MAGSQVSNYDFIPRAEGLAVQCGTFLANTQGVLAKRLAPLFFKTDHTSHISRLLPPPPPPPSGQWLRQKIITNS